MTMSVGLARIINDPDATVLTRKALGALSNPVLLVNDQGLTIDNDGRIALRLKTGGGITEDATGLSATGGAQPECFTQTVCILPDWIVYPYTAQPHLRLESHGLSADADLYYVGITGSNDGSFTIQVFVPNEAGTASEAEGPMVIECSSLKLNDGRPLRNFWHDYTTFPKTVSTNGAPQSFRIPLSGSKRGFAAFVNPVDSPGPGITGWSAMALLNEVEVLVTTANVGGTSEVRWVATVIEFHDPNWPPIP